jgi:hypothetical protein
VLLFKRPLKLACSRFRADVAPDRTSVGLHAARTRSLVREIVDQETSAPADSYIESCRVVTERAALELDTLTIRIPIRLQRRGGRRLIMTPEGVGAPAQKPSRDETLVKALVRAHRWRRRIERGQARSITDLAEQEGVTTAYVCRLLPHTCLAPDIVEAILDGRQPKGLRLAEVLGNGPPAWEEQRSVWR